MESQLFFKMIHLEKNEFINVDNNENNIFAC
jgi:hypothetical protein